MTMAMQLIENPFVGLIGAVLGALLGGALRLLAWVGGWLLALVGWWWRPLGLLAGLVGVVGLCAICPQLPVGLAITAAVGWVTMPRVGGAHD